MAATKCWADEEGPRDLGKLNCVPDSPLLCCAEQILSSSENLDYFNPFRTICYSRFSLKLVISKLFLLTCIAIVEEILVLTAMFI